MKKLLSALFAAMLLVPSGAQAGANRDLARGNGIEFLGPHFSFRASSNPNGTDPDGTVALGFLVTGQEVTFYGEVTCLRVVGGAASIGGRVTKMNPPVALFASRQSFFIQTFDSGKFSPFPDLLSYTVTDAPPPPEAGCPPPNFSGGPLSDGDIIVHDEVV